MLDLPHPHNQILSQLLFGDETQEYFEINTVQPETFFLTGGGQKTSRALQEICCRQEPRDTGASRAAAQRPGEEGHKGSLHQSSKLFVALAWRTKIAVPAFMALEMLSIGMHAKHCLLWLAESKPSL